MTYEVGNKVIVALDPNEQIHTHQEVWKFQGQEHKVSKRKIISYGRGGLQRATYYELEDVKSSMGVPFCFMENQLKPVYD